METEKILRMSVGELPGYGFDCSCGRHHSVDINRIISGSGVVKELPSALEEFKDRTILIVADPNTVKIGGEYVNSLLTGAGYTTELLILDTPEYPILLPDEKTVGTLLIHTNDDTGLLLGVGSGTISRPMMHTTSTASTRSPNLLKTLEKLASFMRQVSSNARR